MTVPSFIYRWQASPDEVVPTRNGWEIDMERIDQGVDWAGGMREAIEETNEFVTFLGKLSRKPANPTLKVARFAWALGAAPAAFNFPPFVSAWRPWKRPWDWERDGC